MKRLIIIFVLTVFSLNLSSITKAQRQVETNLNTIDGQIFYLLQAHQQYLNSRFKQLERELNAFEKDFYTHIGFLNDANAKSFFKTIQSNIQQNPNFKGYMQIAYTSFTSINGKVTGVHYQYLNDGQNVTVIKATNENGKTLKAIYNYDTRGKLLNVKEFKNDTLIDETKHKIKV